MSFQRAVRIEEGRFSHEEVKLLGEYFKIVKEEQMDAVGELYSTVLYESKYYYSGIGESSNSSSAIVKNKQDDDFPKEEKIKPHELDLFPSAHPVLVGCTKCYKYMMVPNNDRACVICGKRGRTVEELMMA